MNLLRRAVATRARKTVAIAPGVLLVPALGLAWWLGSPLFIDTAVDEEFPLSAAQALPTEEPTPTGTPAAEAAATGTAGDPTATPGPTATPTLAPNPAPTPTTVSEPVAGGAPEATPTPTPVETAGPTPTSTPVATGPAGPVALSAGIFRDADSFHKGSGQATIYDLADGSRVLRLEDLNVTNGPDLHVFLSEHADLRTRPDVMAQGYTDLGSLKGNIGNQNYEIPPELDISKYHSVVIYCVPFNVLFSVAPLE